MAIKTINATIQMRKGREEDFAPDQMTAGEWAVSLDSKKVWMCFQPGLVLRMATYESFEWDMKEIQDILATCQDIQVAVEAFEALAEMNKNEAGEKASAASNYAKQSQSYAVGTGNVRPNEAEDNSKRYYEKSKEIFEAFNSGSGEVVGVKGNKESAYRKGFVNLTSENIGAIPETKQLTNQDLNDTTIPGFYYAIGGNSVAHKPSGVAHFGMEVLKSAGSWTTQILYGGDKNVYIRWKTDSGWTTWLRCLNENDKLPQNIGNNGTGGISVGTGLELNGSIEKTFPISVNVPFVPGQSGIEEIELELDVYPGAIETYYGVPAAVTDSSAMSYLAGYVGDTLENQGKVVSYSASNIDKGSTFYSGLYVYSASKVLILYDNENKAESVLGYVNNSSISVTIYPQNKDGQFYQTILGNYNAYSYDYPSNSVPVFSIGGGTSSTARKNLMRLNTDSKMYLGAGGAYNSSGADHAEFTKPWLDGNPENEDRVGYMVAYAYTDNGIFIKKANPGDYIAGITSGNPCLVGNADEDYYWKYERDDFNRLIMEEVPEEFQETDEEGNSVFDEESGEPVMVETGCMVKIPKISESYDSSKPYIERRNRQEWDYVGMVGVIPVRDDGTCVPGQFCKCGEEGIATLAEERGFDTFFVQERISENVVIVELKGF